MMKERKSMSEITIVTAFFDIKRGEMKHYNRSNQKYLEFFKFWSHLQNKIVVYSDQNTIDEVMKIRQEYGLEDKTIPIVVDNYLELDKELYESIDSVMKNKQFLDFHVQRNIPEAISSKYNYIMALKGWCCADAASRGFSDDIIAWMDFGFNYGGVYYKNEEEFICEWKYNFSNKIHLIQIHEDEGMLPFEIIRQNNTYIQGSTLIAPAKMWVDFWLNIRRNMLALNIAGLSDDDQLLYLMCYRQNPEIFEVHKSKDWHSLLRDLSDNNFTYTSLKVSCLKAFLRKIRHPLQNEKIQKLLYSLRTFHKLISLKQRK